MPALKGNSNAQKWTRDKTLKLLNEMEHYITTNATPLIGQAIRYCGANRNTWSYLKKKWEEDDDITERITNIEEDFENKLVAGGMTRKYHWGCVRFLLLTKYQYREPAPENPQPKEETPPPPPEQKLTPKEKKIERLLAAQAERRKNDGKDFAPRDTDTPTMAQTRTRARHHPDAYSSTIPNEPYIKFCDDLFAYIG